MAMAVKKQEANKLTVEERTGIQEQSREYESVLKNVDGLDTGLQDSGAIRDKLAKNKAILERDDKLRVIGKEKDRIVSEIRMLLEKINRIRPTRRMMDLRPGEQGFDEAVQANLRFHREGDVMLLRVKNLQMRLDPDNPMSGDLERIRPT